MAMTRAEMRPEVRFNIKRKISGFTDAQIDTRLNWSQDYISDLHTYEEMRESYTGDTVDGQKKYGFPARMKDIYSMTFQDGANSTKLTYVYARNFDTQVPRPLTIGTGKSSVYVDYGVNFELYKIPDNTYSLVLRASIYPIDFASDSSVSTLLRKDNLIVSIATVFCLQTLRELEDAAYWGGQMVPPLYEASLTSDHSGEDWTPVARGFGDGGKAVISGEWWLNPFTGRRV